MVLPAAVAAKTPERASKTLCCAVRCAARSWPWERRETEAQPALSYRNVEPPRSRQARWSPARPGSGRGCLARGYDPPAHELAAGASAPWRRRAAAEQEVMAGRAGIRQQQRVGHRRHVIPPDDLALCRASWPNQAAGWPPQLKRGRCPPDCHVVQHAHQRPAETSAHQHPEVEPSFLHPPQCTRYPASPRTTGRWPSLVKSNSSEVAARLIAQPGWRCPPGPTVHEVETPSSARASEDAYQERGSRPARMPWMMNPATARTPMPMPSKARSPTCAPPPPRPRRTATSGSAARKPDEVGDVELVSAHLVLDQTRVSPTRVPSDNIVAPPCSSSMRSPLRLRS